MPPRPPSPAEDSDALIVALAQLGDPAAFEKLVQRNQSWIRGLLRRLSADPTLADDLAQQAFFAAWKDLPRLRDARAFHGWLKRIALNTWLKHQRKQDPLRRSTSEESLSGSHAHTSTSDANIDLTEALSTLSDSVRVCVVLSLIEGMSHREIAEAVAIPLGTVKSHIRRGTQQLRETLATYRMREEPT